MCLNKSRDLVCNSLHVFHIYYWLTQLLALCMCSLLLLQHGNVMDRASLMAIERLQVGCGFDLSRSAFM